MLCSNNGFHAIVLKDFIGIWSVQEKDWCQNMNAAYKQLKIHWNLVDHCLYEKLTWNFLFKKKEKVNIDNDPKNHKATVVEWFYCLQWVTTPDVYFQCHNLKQEQHKHAQINSWTKHTSFILTRRSTQFKSNINPHLLSLFSNTNVTEASQQERVKVKRLYLWQQCHITD